MRNLNHLERQLVWHHHSSAFATRIYIPVSRANISPAGGELATLSTTESHSSSLKGVSTTSICLSAAFQTNRPLWLTLYIPH